MVLSVDRESASIFDNTVEAIAKIILLRWYAINLDSDAEQEDDLRNIETALRITYKLIENHHYPSNSPSYTR